MQGARIQRPPASEPLGFEQQAAQGVRVYRLDHVMIEAGRARHALVFLLTPTGERDEQRVPCPFALAQLTSGAVAIEPWHADVEQGDLGSEILRDLERLDAVVGAAYVV